MVILWCNNLVHSKNEQVYIVNDRPFAWNLFYSNVTSNHKYKYVEFASFYHIITNLPNSYVRINYVLSLIFIGLYKNHMNPMLYLIWMIFVCIQYYKYPTWWNNFFLMMYMNQCFFWRWIFAIWQQKKVGESNKKIFEIKKKIAISWPKKFRSHHI
jgi:hypothetical protein